MCLDRSVGKYGLLLYECVLIVLNMNAGSSYFVDKGHCDALILQIFEVVTHALCV